MAVDKVDTRQLDALLNTLDARARQAGAGESLVGERGCQRKSPRRPFRVGCTVRFLADGSTTVSEVVARTRNLSRCGMALLVKRVFTVGEPLEIEAEIPGRSTVFMAGVVAFCRYAAQGYYEVGGSLKTVDEKPVFSDNPSAAMEQYDWLRAAVESLRKDAAAPAGDQHSTEPGTPAAFVAKEPS
jgi:hypothetical protein